MLTPAHARLEIALATLLVSCVAGCSTGLKIDQRIDAALADVVVIDAAVTDAVAMPTRCDGPDAEVPSSLIVAPDVAVYRAAIAPLQTQVFSYPAVLEIPLTSCSGARFQAQNVIGSAFLDMYPAANGDCVIWTGGFEEFVDYNGLPSQYCRFPASCGHLSVPSNMWGGLSIDSPWCVSSGFCLDCPEL